MSASEFPADEPASSFRRQETTATERLRRGGIFALVVGAHVIFLMLSLETQRYERFQEPSARRTSLFFSSTPVIERNERMPRSPVEPQIRTNITIDVREPASAAVPDGSSATGSVAAPSVNWEEEARRAAGAAVDAVPRADLSKCDSTGLADPKLPNCKPPSHFKWAPPRSGFSGGLPYIKLGDRCAVGLGFFGCALGKSPAKGDLFDDMDDPDRERSSVPGSLDKPGDANPAPDSVTKQR